MKLPIRYRRMVEDIRILLTEKRQLEEVDALLIDEVGYNLYLMDEARKSIKRDGISVNIRPAGEAPYFQINPSVGVYQAAVKTLAMLCTKLGLTVQERNKLKLVSDEDNDDFDD